MSSYIELYDYLPLPKEVCAEIQDTLIDKIFPLLEGYTIDDIETSFDRIKRAIHYFQAIGKVPQVSSRWIQS